MPIISPIGIRTELKQDLNASHACPGDHCNKCMVELWLRRRSTALLEISSNVIVFTFDSRYNCMTLIANMDVHVCAVLH